MRFTSEDLMKAMGLQIGDRIKYNNQIWTIEKSEECQGAWVGYTDGNRWSNIDNLVNGLDFEILPRPKRVGDTLCKDVECEKCPLRMIVGCENASPQYTLYQCLEEVKDTNEKNNMFDQEIYDLIKSRLDKEVE